MDFGIEVVDLIKLACARAEYLIINGLSALGLIDRIGCDVFPQLLKLSWSNVLLILITICYQHPNAFEG